MNISHTVHKRNNELSSQDNQIYSVILCMGWYLLTSVTLAARRVLKTTVLNIKLVSGLVLL